MRSKPQYDIWSLKRISGVKVCKQVEVDEFKKYFFKAHRGSNPEIFEFSLVDLPITNPHDLIVL